MFVNSTAVIAELCVYLLTWNVASKSPNSVNMKDMLSLNGPSSCPNGQLPDTFVVGFQEVKVLSFGSGNDWTTRVGKHLSPLNYVQVGSQKMQGLLVNIWVQARHKQHINSVETSSTGTGVGHFWGNKGAVSVRMNLYGAPIAFVVSHLAAHDEKLEDRIEDFHSIIGRHYYRTNNYNSLLGHDVIFWSGDLNFRLNGDDSAQDIENKINNGQLTELFAHDQLRFVKQSGRAFTEFDEAIPMFPPTFKFKEGSSNYNLKRRPAWCDRILYRIRNSTPGLHLGLTQLSYKSHPQYTISDHKPVTSEFLLTVNVDHRLTRML